MIDREGWRKIGARLRLNVRQNLLGEQIPKRPMVLYSHKCFDMNTDDNYPLGFQTPRATQKPAVLGNSDSFLDLIRDKDDPEELRDYISLMPSNCATFLPS